MPADIPPPTEADMEIDLAFLSRLYHELGGKSAVAAVVRRCHAAEAECERLRGLRDRAEVAFGDLEAAERRLDRLSDAVKDNDRLRAELAEAVRLLEPFAAVWSEEGLVLHCGDCKAAAAFVAKHKGNA